MQGSITSQINIMKPNMVFHNQEESTLPDYCLNGKRILVITGEVNSGKTLFAEKIAGQLKAEGKSVSGILTKGIFTGSIKSGYDVIDLSNGKSYRLAINYPKNNFNINQNKFYFNDNVFNNVNKLINNINKSDYIFFDEIGHLELAGKGFYPSFKFCLEKRKGKLIIVARKSLFDDVLNKFNIDRDGVEVLWVK